MSYRVDCSLNQHHRFGNLNLYDLKESLLFDGSFVACLRELLFGEVRLWVDWTWDGVDMLADVFVFDCEQLMKRDE